MLPPSTVVASAGVSSATAWCCKACATFSAVTSRAGRGGPGLKNTLIQCTWAAARKNGSYLQAQFQRLRSRPATKRTIGALAASILTAAYHMLKHGTLYHDLGPNTSTAGPRPFRPGRRITHLHKLGYAVRITL